MGEGINVTVASPRMESKITPSPMIILKSLLNGKWSDRSLDFFIPKWCLINSADLLDPFRVGTYHRAVRERHPLLREGTLQTPQEPHSTYCCCRFTGGSVRCHVHSIVKTASRKLIVNNKKQSERGFLRKLSYIANARLGLR